jgi:hypothetical protein
MNDGDLFQLTDAVSGPLDHYADKQTDEQTVSVAGRRDEELPGGTNRERDLALDGFTDLAVFIDKKRIVLVTVCMKFGQNIESLFLAAVRDEETRRLRDD